MPPSGPRHVWYADEPHDGGGGGPRAGPEVSRSRPIPTDGLEETEEQTLSGDVEAGISVGWRLAAGEIRPEQLGFVHPDSEPEAADDSFLAHLPSAEFRLVDISEPEAPVHTAATDAVWEHPAFEQRRRALQDEIDDIAASLAAVLRQDLNVHETVLARAGRRARSVALRVAALRADDPFAHVKDVLDDARDEIDTLFTDTLERGFARFYTYDLAIVGLEQAMERLETLPEALERNVVLYFDTDDWPSLTPRWPWRSGGRVRIHVPVRRAISLALMRADVQGMINAFSRLLDVRRNFLTHLERVRADVLAELQPALEANSVGALDDGDDEADDESRPLSTLVASLTGQQADGRSLLERARTAVLELEGQLVHATVPLRQLYERMLGRVVRIASSLHRAIFTAADNHSIPGRLSITLRKVLRAVPYGLRRWWSHVRGADADRVQQRVRYHPRLRAFLHQLEGEVDDALDPLTSATRADLAHHAETLAHLRGAFEIGLERLREAFAEHNVIRWRSLRTLKRKSQRQLKRIYTTLEREVMAPLWMYYADDPVVACLESTAARIEAVPEHLPVQLELGYEERASLQGRPEKDHRDGRTRPREHSVTIRTRDIVAQWLERHEIWTLEMHADGLRELRTTLVQRLQEVWNIVRYNIEGAMAEAEEAIRLGAEAPPELLDKCRDMALGGVQRAGVRLDDILDELDTFHRAVLLDFDKTTALSVPVGRDAAAAATFRGHLRFRIASLGLATRRQLNRLKRWLARRTREIGDVVRTRVQAVARSRVLREVFGLSIEEQATTETLDETPAALESEEDLPPVYRRLFAREPLQLEEFLIARETELELLVRAREAFRAGERRAVLVYGGPGSGKRSLINCACDRFGDAVTVRRHRIVERIRTPASILERIASILGIEPASVGISEETPDLEAVVDALVDTITERTPRAVVVLENAHRAWLREIRGFEPLQTLLMIISRTSHHLLWILSMRAHAFSVLQRLFRISDAFSHVVPLEGLDAEQLERAMLARHELSGYRLRFVADDVTRHRLRRELRGARGDSQLEQRILADHFYERLRALSGGNIHTAILYWLRSVKRSDDEGELLVQAPSAIEVPLVEKLSSDQLFGLAAVVLHGSLSARELAAVLGWDLLKSRMAIQFYHHRGLTEVLERHTTRERELEDDVVRDVPEETRDIDDVKYRLTMPVVMPIIRVLENRNIIHWSTP